MTLWWSHLHAEVHRSFTSNTTLLDPSIVLNAASSTSPQVVRSACLRWAIALLLKPIGNDMTTKLTLIANTLAPIQSTCRLVDASLGLDSKTEAELLNHARTMYLDKGFIEDIRVWAKNALGDECLAQEAKTVAFSLFELGWIPALEACFTDVAYQVVRERISDNCASNFDQPDLLDNVLLWTNSVLVPWLDSMLDPAVQEISARRLEFFVHQTFGELRASEFFDIVTGFPESAPAVDDLKRCLIRTRAYRVLIFSVNEAIQRRLLHGGANTNSILLVYVRLIKTLRRLDPKGLILQAVSEPVKQYLRLRSETVRCIVMALTNNGTNADLHAELGLNKNSTEVRAIDFDMNDEALMLDGGGVADQDATEDESDGFPPVIDANAVIIGNFPQLKRNVFDLYNWRGIPNKQDDDAWEPEPIEANPESSIHSRAASDDILSMLVRVYDSKELFVNEYRNFLAQRLLSKTNSDDTEEYGSLELLKIRFGDSTMLACDIMLRDMTDSRRANANITDTGIETIIVSRYYWPQFASSAVGMANDGNGATLTGNGIGDGGFRVHEKVKRAMDDFGEKYAKLKRPRKLLWTQQFGSVDLDLEFPDGTKKSYSNLSTLQTNMILFVSEAGIAMEVKQLAESLGMELDLTRRKMTFWIGEGVVSEDRTSGTYSIAHTAPIANATGASAEDGDDDEFYDDDQGDHDLSMHEANEEEEQAAIEVRDQAHINFITTMLTNLGLLALSDIHRNIQMFSAALGEHAAYDRTEEELEEFLEVYVDGGMLEIMDDGKYKVLEEE